jgi:hypothetical protein
MRPAADTFMPRALAESAARYGTIGVAFTYLAWLYVASLLLLATAILGQAVAADSGRLGRYIRRGEPARTQRSGEPGEAPVPAGAADPGKGANP